MTGTCDVITCADIVYGKHFRTPLLQISLISAENDFSAPIPGYALLENGIHYHDSDFTVAECVLQHGTSILKSEN